MKKMLTKLFKWINDFLGKIPRWVLIIFFAALPTVLTILMVRFYFHTSLETFRPIIGNDNVYYWHEILTFNKVGLQGGYYSYLELTPKAGIFHFGPHGPIFEITYGLISKITGWGNATFLYIQMVLLGLGFIFFAWRTRLSQSQILLSGLAIITCWPVLTNTLMTLEENFHQAIGILLAGVLAGVISWQHKLPVWQKICLIILFIYIGWVRYTWVLFLIPTLILIFPKTKRHLLLALGLGLILAVVIFWIYSFTASPGYNVSIWAVEGFKNGFRQNLHEIKRGILLNIDRILHPFFFSWAVANIQYLFLMLIVGIDGVVLILKKKYIPDSERLINKRLVTDLIIFFTMLTMFIYCLTLFTMNNAFRLFSATMIIALLLLVWSRRYWPVIIVVIISLVTIPSFIDMFKTIHNGEFTYDSIKIEETKKGMEQFVSYDPSASNPWCNTILMPATISDYRAYIVPAGVGISYYVPQYTQQKPPFPLKSKFVLLDQEEYDRLNLAEQNRLQLLITLPESLLFRNLDSGCP